MENQKVNPGQVDNWLQYPSEHLIPGQQVMIQKLNYYNAVMIERAVQYHEALARMNVDPNVIVNTSEGPKTIEVIVDLRRTLLLEIVSTVETAQKMLLSAGEGTLDSWYTGDALSIPTWSADRVAALAEEDKEKQ